MTSEEKLLLWNNVADKFFASSDSFWLSSLKLALLLQTSEWADYMRGQSYPMSEKLKRQLEMLSGPYAETIHKALLAKQLSLEKMR